MTQKIGESYDRINSEIKSWTQNCNEQVRKADDGIACTERGSLSKTKTVREALGFSTVNSRDIFQKEEA